MYGCTQEEMWKANPYKDSNLIVNEDQYLPSLECCPSLFIHLWTPNKFPVGKQAPPSSKY